MQAADRQALEQKLESAYALIRQQRMDGVPMLNNRLNIKAVGFREWNSHILGVMLTPWFMNLMLMPGDGDDWRELETLSKTQHIFPSGKYEFIVGEEASIGKYQICSLFSPMFEFQDQETALATAEAVMSALMDEKNQADISNKQKEIEAIWYDDSQPQNMTDRKRHNENRITLKERIQCPMNRREVLSGAFLTHTRKTT